MSRCACNRSLVDACHLPFSCPVQQVAQGIFPSAALCNLLAFSSCLLEERTQSCLATSQTNQIPAAGLSKQPKINWREGGELAAWCAEMLGKKKKTTPPWCWQHPSNQAGEEDGKGVRDEVEDRDERRDGGGGQRCWLGYWMEEGGDDQLQMWGLPARTGWGRDGLKGAERGEQSGGWEAERDGSDAAGG